MSSPARTVTIPWASFFFSLLGLLWCGYVAFPGSSSAFCESSGCALISNFRIFGISLWWIGGAYFLLLCIVCLKGNVYFAWWLSRVALALDCILLLIMFFFAPCASCLIVALLLGITNFTLKPNQQGWFSTEKVRFIILPIWVGFFLGNFVLFVDEKMPRWVINSDKEHSIIVYFSPSCHYCKEALLLLGSQAKLYPVLEKKEDLAMALELEEALRSGSSMEEAIERISKGDVLKDVSFVSRVFYNLQSLRNEVPVAKNSGVLPLIVINGMPVEWMKKEEQATEKLEEEKIEDNTLQDPIALSGTEFGMCTQGAAEPCD